MVHSYIPKMSGMSIKDICFNRRIHAQIEEFRLIWLNFGDLNVKLIAKCMQVQSIINDMQV